MMRNLRVQNQKSDEGRDWRSVLLYSPWPLALQPLYSPDPLTLLITLLS